MLCDLRESELDGQQAEDRLHEIGITVNRNAVPFDPRPPAISSGLRIGTPALATRGLQRDDFAEVGTIIAETLNPEGAFAESVTVLPRACARSPSAIRCTRTWAPRPPSERRLGQGRSVEYSAGSWLGSWVLGSFSGASLLRALRQSPPGVTRP